MLYHVLTALFQGRHYAYENPLFRASLAALLSFLIVIFASPWFIRQLLRWKLGDQPEFDHPALNELNREKRNVPTMGGLLILASIACSMLLLCDLTNFYIHLCLVCLFWLTILGAVDDWLKLTSGRRSGSRDGLKTYEKLLFQIGLGVLIGYYVYRHGHSNYAHAVVSPLIDSETLPAFRIISVPFYKAGIMLSTAAFMIVTVIVMTGTSNAVNLTDGMDGLATGCVAICALVFVILTHIVGTEEVAAKLLFLHVPKSAELVIPCGAMFGACLGFLWYNCHPAHVFMGDTGSLPLGGIIGFIAIVTRQELMLLIVGGVFVMEALSVIAQVAYFKWTKGSRIFRCAPIHHHFHLSGWSETQTVVRFWVLAAMFASLALASIKLR